MLVKNTRARAAGGRCPSLPVSARVWQCRSCAKPSRAERASGRAKAREENQIAAELRGGFSYCGEGWGCPGEGGRDGWESCCCCGMFSRVLGEVQSADVNGHTGSSGSHRADFNRCACGSVNL